MAVKDQGEHAFKRLGKDIKAGTLPGVVMVCGVEEYLIRWACDTLKKEFVAKGAESLDYMYISAKSSSAAEAVMALNAFPMMSERRVIVLADTKMMGGQGSPSFDEDELAASVSEVSSDTSLLILTGPKPDARKKTYKTVNGNGGVYDFSKLDRATLVSFIKKRLKGLGKTAGAPAINAIIDVSGYFEKDSEYMLDNLVNDIEKLAAFSEGEITPRDVTEMISGSEERGVFVFLDSLVAGKTGEAVRVLLNILDSGGNEFQILGALCSQLEIMMKVREMKDDGMSKDEMVKRLGVHEFRVKKAMSQINRFSRERMRSVLLAAYRIEKDIKTGYLDGRAALELFASSL